MRTIAKLFGRSPFVPLQAHMEKVAACVALLVDLFEAYAARRSDEVEKLAKEISRLEHEADLLKHDIQSQLPRGMFLPVERDRLLEILAIQDNIADKSENIGVLLTLKQTAIPPAMETPFRTFLGKNLEAFDGVRKIVDELDHLVSTGFGGAEAERVRQMVMNVAQLEYEADHLQHGLLKILFANEDNLSVADFFLWDKIFKQVSELSNLSERLAHRMHRTLDLK
ncbi:MAG: TIGR00153 family protein [Acidobacteriota bacterium]|jgi:predicted phosphate transport protein (TIGR00153 family)